MDVLTEPVVDFLQESIDHPDYNCARCGHGLTGHTSGPTLHGRCLLCRECPKAVLTEGAKRKVKHGLLP